MKIYKENEIDELAKIIREDGVVCIPVDTVYGICARINSVKAYNKLKTIKDRPSDKSFPIMCADKEQIKSIAIINKKQEKLIDEFMPGAITLIVNKKNGVIINNRGGYTNN